MIKKILKAILVVELALAAMFLVGAAVPASADINNPHPVPANGSVNTLQLADGAVTDAKVAAAAAIQLFKLGTTNDATDIPFSNGTNLATSSSFTLDSNGPTVDTTRIAVSSASTSFNGVHYAWPASQASGGNQVLTNDGTGSLSWAVAGGGLTNYQTPVDNVGTASGTAYTITVPASTLGTGHTIHVTLTGIEWANSIQSNGMSVEAAYGTATTSLSMFDPSNGPNFIRGQLDFYVQGAGSTGSQNTVLSFTTMASSSSQSQYATSTISTNSAVSQPLIIRIRQNGGGVDYWSTWINTVQLIN